MSSVAPGGMDPQKVELVLAELDSLPPLAPVATRILALTGRCCLPTTPALGR